MPEAAFDAAVIGGGPAGLFAAIRYAGLSGGDARVVVLERKRNPCRKLLVSGSGQCNITHSGSMADFLPRYGGGAKPGAAGRFLRPALYGFSNDDLLDWFGERGLEFETEEGGKVFPSSRRASAVLDVMLAEAARLGVTIRGDRRVLSLSRDGAAFDITALSESGTSGEAVVATEPNEAGQSGEALDRQRESVRALAVLVATGGASYPGTGSTGDGYRLAASLGHSIVAPRPALAPAYSEPFALSPAAGLSFRGAGLTVRRGGKKVSYGEGDLLITHRGLSGPLVLDASRGIRTGDVLEARFAALGPDEFRARFDEVLSARPRRLARTALADCGLPRSLADLFCSLAGVSASALSADLRRASREALITLACACPVPVSALGGPDEAMATAGGVALGEVDPRTMESRLVPGLYFAGEVLDYDGDTGGYNLQAAFSTGAAAGGGMGRLLMTDI
ncbi:MAG: aminoacetone oxidase family FAD-binding enzyme [Spirochaetes bacterium]|nr:aminoacetone oxidase family FAD-binding enzyme [Spirochaetota bacterium]MBU1080144.1 aminoacetone oxidase family FAD-binding enzyme [Spirochaetota bacterium]